MGLLDTQQGVRVQWLGRLVILVAAAVVLLWLALTWGCCAA
jgi:hypothetical protein